MKNLVNISILCCEPLPLLGERAHPATRLGWAVAGARWRPRYQELAFSQHLPSLGLRCLVPRGQGQVARAQGPPGQRQRLTPDTCSEMFEVQGLWPYTHSHILVTANLAAATALQPACAARAAELALPLASSLMRPWHRRNTRHRHATARQYVGKVVSHVHGRSCACAHLHADLSMSMQQPRLDVALVPSHGTAFLALRPIGERPWAARSSKSLRQAGYQLPVHCFSPSSAGSRLRFA